MPRRYTSSKRKFPRRKFTKKRRFTRRKRRAGRSMSTKAILNLTSVKKKDTMIQGQVLGDGSVSTAPYFRIDMGPNSYTAWCQNASYRERGNSLAAPVRNLRDIYLKGFAETIRVDTNSGNPLFVRRMVVSMPNRIDLTGGASIPNNQPTRVVKDGIHYIGIGNGPLNTGLYELIFAGRQGTDWSDVLSAKLDSRRMRIHSDKTLFIKSGNAAEAVKQYKFWDRINKKVQYDDEEIGNDVFTSGFTTTSTQGHQQNVYVVYLFFNPSGVAVTTDIAQQRTMYWHER
ncbi:Cap [Zizania latifolia genomoviridae]|uniref:Cap n=2 Tax=root TaxID=1 RepID=A0A6N0GYF8_9VIRU|nr:Cap [Zizania latifolia genomoviridae]QKQ15110.1 Cap [Zizania latifolia genomoviridae]